MIRHLNKKYFLESITTAATATERRTNLPILENLMLRSDGCNLTVTGTDLQSQIQTRMSFSGGTDNKIAACIPTAKLINLVKLCPDDSDIELDDSAPDRVIVKYGRSRFNLSALPVENFPAFEVDGQFHSIEIPTITLFEHLYSTITFAARDDVRYYLCGVYLSLNGDDLITAASDGHHLARCASKIEKQGQEIEIIIPRTSVDQLIKLISAQLKTGKDQLTRIGFHDRSLSVNVDADTVYKTKLLEGRFPDINRVIPKDSKTITTVRLDKKDTIAAINRCQLILEKTDPIKLEITENGCSIRSSNKHSETADEQLTAVSHDGQPISLGLNPRLILDSLNQIDHEHVILKINDRNTITVLDPENQHWLAIVMPMMV